MTETPKASSVAITINLITMGLGSGLLTMPWGAAGASVAMALFLLAVVLALNFWTIMIIVRACERWQEFDLGGLFDRLPGKLGPRMGSTVDAIIWVSQFLVLLGYTDVVADSMLKLLPADSAIAGHTTLAVLLGIVVLPLSMLDQRYLAFTSTLSILANVYMVGLIIVYAFVQGDASRVTADSSEYGGSPLCLFGLTKGSITLFSLLMYTIIIQMVIPDMYQELEGRSPEKFRTCLTIAFAVLFFIFAAVMVGGYVAFGPSVESNALNNFGSDFYGDIARVAMVVCLLGCYPLNIKPMLAPCERVQEALGAWWSRRRAAQQGNLQDSLLAPSSSKASGGGCRGSLMPILLIVAAITVCSLWCRDLGPLNAINGAISVVGYVGLAPGVIGLYLVGEIEPQQRLSMLGLMIFSFSIAALGVFITDNDVLSLEAGCMSVWTL